MSSIPHASETYSIEINGKVYDNLASGFYVRIPEKGLICFSTESAIGSLVLHVVPVISGIPELQIKLPKEISGFGSAFGSKKTDVGSTFIEAISGDLIYFTEKISSGVIGHYCLNLKEHTIAKVDASEISEPHEPTKAR